MVTVESHIIDRTEGDDFYGQRMQLCLCVFLRPEIKFDSFPALLAQIHADIEDSRFILREAEDSASVYSRLRASVLRVMENKVFKADHYLGFITLPQFSDDQT